jgi:hypothetical protein
MGLECNCFNTDQLGILEREPSMDPRTLEFAYEVIAGTIHNRPHFLISKFSPPYMHFLAFVITKLESTILI